MIANRPDNSQAVLALDITLKVIPSTITQQVSGKPILNSAFCLLGIVEKVIGAKVLKSAISQKHPKQYFIIDIRYFFIDMYNFSCILKSS